MADPTLLPPPTDEQIRRGVNANLVRLAGCSGHVFLPRTHDPSGRVSEFQCSSCFGTVTPVEVYWHEAGRKNGLIDVEVDALLRLLSEVAEPSRFVSNLVAKLAKMRTKRDESRDPTRNRLPPIQLTGAIGSGR